MRGNCSEYVVLFKHSHTYYSISKTLCSKATIWQETQLLQRSQVPQGATTTQGSPKIPLFSAALTSFPKETVQKCSFLNSRTPSMVSASLSLRSSCGTRCAGVVCSSTRPQYSVSGCIVPSRHSDSSSEASGSAQWVSLEQKRLVVRLCVFPVPLTTGVEPTIPCTQTPFVLKWSGCICRYFHCIAEIWICFVSSM